MVGEEEAIENTKQIRRLGSGDSQRITNLERKLITILNRIESLEKSAAHNIQLIVEAKGLVAGFKRELKVLRPKGMLADKPSDRLDLLEDRIDKIEGYLKFSDR